MIGIILHQMAAVTIEGGIDDNKNANMRRIPGLLLVGCVLYHRVDCI